MHEIPIHCRTNLDLAGEKWPRSLPIVPRVGDNIESLTKHGNFRLSLRVAAVNFRAKSEFRLEETHTVEIELHDKFQRSIRDFYEWYAPLVGKSVSSFI